MANKELLELTAAGTLGGTESFYIVDDDGNSRRLSLADLKAFVNTDPTIVPSSVPWRGARVRRTSDLSVTTGVTTNVAWQTATIDTDSIWSGGAPTRLTVPAGVTKVRLFAGVRFASGSTGSRQVIMFMNGATFQGRGALHVPAVTSQPVEINVASGAITVVAGDYFEAIAFHTQGSALAVASHESTWFEMEIVEG